MHFYLLFILTFLQASSTSLLNSERIEARFGSYGVAVLRNDPSGRISNLYSVHNGSRITRTLAIVTFHSPLPASLGDVHRRIVEGDSIGRTLKAAGWRVTKETFEICMATPEGAVTEWLDGMGLPSRVRLAHHRYELSIARNDEMARYATIAEIHHPDYLTVDQLVEIYAPGASLAPEDYVKNGDYCYIEQ